MSERRFDFDLFVIGGGSGGVRCARIAAGHGARVGIAEERFWGGTCVNVGCVPKKLMVLAAGYGPAAEDARGFGWHAERGTHDWAGFIATKDAEIARLNGIYVKLLSGAGVELFEAHARFLDPHTLDVGGRRVTAERIVIATGGHPHRHDLPGAQHAALSDDIFHLPAMPRRIAIMGSGYIAVEFAGIFAGLGAEVDLIFRQPRPLRGFDDDLREALAEAMTAQGIRLHAARTARRIEQHGETSVVHLDDGGAITTDLAFLALGRRPNLRGLELDRAGVRVNERGAIAIDAEWRTSARHIHAIGDVTDRINLTPVAIAEGHTLADLLFGMPPGRSWSFAAVPSAVFSSPPIGTVGLTEAQAAARGPTDIYLTRFTPMRHTMSGRPLKTMMKLVVDQATDRVLGAHMLGEEAPEIVQGLAVAITARATKSQFDRTIGIHPTAAEEFVTLRTRTRAVGVAAAAE